MTPTPGPPFYGGRQLGALAVNAKARVAQLTGFRSITAAAERLVTFGCFFYRWKARLWVRWGSSCAVGGGGRLIAAPTAENGPSHNQGRSPHPSGLRPAPLPLLAFSHFPLSGGIGLPLKGKACGRPRGSPLHKKQTGSVGSANPGAEAEPQQSQFSSRSGPQWGRMGPHPSTPDFARRKCSAHFKG